MDAYLNCCRAMGVKVGIIERILMFLFRHRDIVKDGNLYLRRFYITPRSWKWRVFIHHIMRSDEDRDPHDHPWAFFTLMLKGQYREHLTVPCDPHHNTCMVKFVTLKRWRCLYRRATDIHRLFLTHGPVWTLVVAGKTVRLWGFWTYDGWVHWREYLGLPKGPEESS